MRALLLATLLLLPAPAAAQAVHQFRRGEPAALRGDTAYLLFRADLRARPGEADWVLLREAPGEAGADATPGEAAPPRFDAAAAIVRTDARYPYAEAPGERSYLLAVPPGSYVIAATTWKRMPSAGTCQCMGTVRFEARPGVVNDLGFLLGVIEDRPTTVPELAPYAAPATPYRVTPALVLATVRPAAPGMSIPEPLRALPVTPAAYRAVGKFPNIFRTMINRMAPIPGVLAYDGDRPIDPPAR